MTAIQQFERIHAEDIAMRDAGIESTREQDQAYRAARPHRRCATHHRIGPADHVRQRLYSGRGQAEVL